MLTSLHPYGTRQKPEWVTPNAERAALKHTQLAWDPYGLGVGVEATARDLTHES